ncbi:ACT domain-containing protein [Ideonella sp. DXS29W]|uniref:ACT domain-containing protein n=1 Tax=Ideonella lacteola TaxID=2984193 RepID=A0ABU9BXK0_9BURK
MSPHLSSLAALLQSLEPSRHDGVYAYAVLPFDTDPASLQPVVTVREAEGVTVIVPIEQAERHGLRVLFRAAWITLTVHSDLQAVGLTAAFSGALAMAGVSCNVVAGAHHDHLFVPEEQAQQALDVLRALQRTAPD